jgi:hypothetical protein
MADLNQATEKVKELRAEFKGVADDAGTRKFFESWFDDKAKRKNDFDAFATMAGMAEQLLAAEQPAAAKIPLDNLKTLFDNRATAWRKASHGFFASWTGRETHEAERYEGYSKKVDAVLKLL